MNVDPVVNLSDIAPEWEQLWRADGQTTPFQHPGWLLPWWETFGSGRLFSWAVRVDSRLVGLALTFLHPWQGWRQVTFIGNGVSDHLDILAHPGCRAEAVASLLEKYAEHRSCWDVCDLQDLSEHSSLLHTTVPRDMAAEVKPQYACTSVPLDGSPLPHGLRRNLRRYRSQLEEHGTVTLEQAGTTHSDEYIEALFALHRARWASKNDKGMLDGSAMETFHSRAAKNFWAAGLVRLYALRFNDKIVSIIYALRRGSTAYSYLGGFDPALARFSPGSILLEYAMQQLLLEGATEFDFLRGDEPYKATWGARPYTTYRLLLRPEK